MMSSAAERAVAPPLKCGADSESRPGRHRFQLLEGEITMSNTTFSRRSFLTLGSIAVKEFDETDPELSRALKDAYYVGIRTGRGLKVDLP